MLTMFMLQRLILGKKKFSTILQANGIHILNNDANHSSVTVIHYLLHGILEL